MRGLNGDHRDLRAGFVFEFLQEASELLARGGVNHPSKIGDESLGRRNRNILTTGTQGCQEERTDQEKLTQAGHERARYLTAGDR